MSGRNLPQLDTNASNGFSNKIRKTHSQKFLSKGKFVITKTAFIKIFSILIMVVSLVIFILKPTCPNSDSWYSWLFPISSIVTVVVQVSLYIFFALGFAKQNPKKWISLDICVSIILSLLIITVSVLTMTNCKGTVTLHKIPGPLGICGGGVIIISVAAIFLMYRHEPKIEEPISPTSIRPTVKEDVFA